MSRLKYLSIVILFLVIVSSCDRNRNHPGWDYFPDMFYSEAYETYTPNPNFDDGKTMRVPVEGTIARDYIPFDYGIETEERTRAGLELKNPYAHNEKAVKGGGELYKAFCANCHGKAGNGDGHLYTSGKYLVKPRSLVNQTARNLKDGEIFHTISLGFGSMGAHESQIRYDDRWMIVSYIRAELQLEYPE